MAAQLISQAKAVGMTLVWSGIGSAILFKLVDIVIGLRPSEEKEREGLDITDHGESAGLPLKDGGKLGSHVFVLNGANAAAQGMHWSAITHQQAATPLTRDDVVMQRISAEPAFVNEMKARMHPGMTMVLTDAPLSPDKRSSKDFVIVTTG
ncbi:hypothetical protein [Methylocystis parvus]|uniref:hypothetical protein n=1 Tax=Methylocystis parvus TaxID=134 RepID=UPI003C729EFC